MSPEELWESYKPLAYKIARMGDWNNYREDLEQSALMYLWIAACNFDENVGVTFGTYAKKVVVHGVIDERDRSNLFGCNIAKKLGRCDVPAIGSIFGSNGIIDIEDSRRRVELLNIEDKDFLEFLVSKIEPEKVNAVIRKLFLERLSVNTIARQMDLSVRSIQGMAIDGYEQMLKLSRSILS